MKKIKAGLGKVWAFIKKHKKMVIILSIVIIAGIVALVVLNPGRTQTQVSMPSTTVLSKTSLEQITTVTGTNTSASSRSVNAEANAKITQVLVEVGDTVSAGQVLARLDSSDLNTDIKNAQSDLATAQASADRDNAWAQEDLNSAQNSFNSANDAYNQARDAYLVCEADATCSDLSAKQQAMQNAEQSKSQAESSLTQAQRQYDKQVSTDSTSTARRQLTDLQSSLKDYTITAPIAGVITEMNAVVGEPASGGSSSASSGSTTGTGSTTGQSSALFLIEDLGTFSIDFAVPEYDGLNIKVGNLVRITADSIDDETWDAKVTKVSPTVTDGNFTVTVDILSEAKNLKIGMSISADIITESVDNVFVVPYDAVVKNAEGADVVYAIEMSDMLANRQGFNSDFSENRTEIKVTMGMETDYYVEISGEGLKEGTIILNDPNSESVATDSVNQAMMFNMGGGGGAMPSGGFEGGGAMPSSGGGMRAQ